ncbi:MAG: hypothetical protein A2600_09415 [Candidatus Lambdaproteobacteria bacterium RIFOXYD1_FULL_56_27]|uniref:Major facilitator superfamily (MFS) profile domain-containing protein n=1 Tax=Candidatus Lambdaproteobacteria bacterium RIFOXYD2_FULL_56_26 TaxID=1817773 RepID=A0A1F6GV31_9PROT|nr:MAG: hypothetical protein A2557_04685 [Candidatus Lambdaproteobacteria bacterium RIFOXYD2_FULL_56_26]OGH02270.1 MAG: hypothetical protein A2426_03165 [Candidatus Lambdaproteobacteria bacterium RIFOXYC1_FULL_56_13]OGH10039.1 MAG: hypothetical protein A2600_09415 [Candidatus Lambdaproteobacteria bacterium RIFOXYD1_FULL_56_27]
MKEIHSPKFFGTLLFLLNFLVMMDYLVMVPLVMDISRTLGLAPTRTGFLLSSYPIAAALSSLLLAPFSDRLGRKKMTLFLLAGFSLASLGVALSTEVWQIFLFRILSGVFGGPVLPNSFAFAGDTFKGEDRGRIIANLSLSFSAASIFGVPMGAWIGSWLGWQGVFGMISLLSLLGLIPFLALPSVPTQAEGKILSQYRQLLGLWALKPVQLAFGLQFLMLIGLFGVVPNIAVWFSTNYGYDAGQIALCYMQGGIGAVLGNRLAGEFLKRRLRRGLISGGSLVMALFLGVACSEWVPDPPLGLFFAGMMFGGSIRVPVHQLNLSELLPIQFRGRLMSMNTIVGHLAMGLGGFWSSPLLHIEGGHLYGMQTIGLVGVGALCLVPWIALAFGRSTRHQTVY